jgi:hypothetical protein
LSTTASCAPVAGYQSANLPERYSAVPTLMKPFQAADIAAALQRAVGGG